MSTESSFEQSPLFAYEVTLNFFSQYELDKEGIKNLTLPLRDTLSDAYVYTFAPGSPVRVHAEALDDACVDTGVIVRELVPPEFIDEDWEYEDGDEEV